MSRCIDVRRHMHRGGDCLGQHTGLGHVVLPLNLDIFEIRPVRALKSIAVRQVIELDAHIVVQVFLKLDPANHH